MKNNQLIELWKPDCRDCEAAKPIIADLESQGYKFEKHNIEEPEGRQLWEKYADAIDEYSRQEGWEEGYIYTPTFINPVTGQVVAFADRPPTKDELVKFARVEAGRSYGQRTL